MLHSTTLGDEFVETRNAQETATVVSSCSFRQLKDTDAMPFGLYREERMRDVLAAYLDHLRDANWLSTWPAFEDYIERKKAIDKELKDAKRGSSRY